MNFRWSVIFLAPAFIACGGIAESARDSDAQTSDSAAIDSSSPFDRGECSTDSDCAAGSVCGFSTAQMCGAKGSCVLRAPLEHCNSMSEIIACGCDETDVFWAGPCAAIYPKGYAPKPISHLGPCAPCSSDSDCGQGKACAYPIDEGCFAQKECVDAMALSGACNMLTPPVRGCDGTCVGIGCGASATRKPVVISNMHLETCDN